MDYQAKADKVIKSAYLMTLATASKKGIPHAAVLLCAGDLKRIYFYTFKEGRKYVNLLKNKTVSLVIFNKEGYVQVNGSAKQLRGQAAKKARTAIVRKNGKGSGYLDDPNVAYFSVKPKLVLIRLKGTYPSEYRALQFK